MFNKKKILALGLTLVLGTSVLAGCGTKEDASDKGDGGETSAETIKIGAIVPETGEVSVYGKAALSGYNLAIKEYNAKWWNFR